MKMDSLPYKVFKQIKDKYVQKIIKVTEDDLTSVAAQVLRSHRDFIQSLADKEGIEIYRWSHNYASLETSNPELGPVYLANDSVINPGFDVILLIGHNAKYKTEN